jgi:hypothetical protein
MDKLDIINSPNKGKHKFSAAEMKACEKNGECCQCGLCCIAPEMNIPNSDPSVTPEDGLTHSKKTGLEICPFLEETRNGLFRCLIHGSKESCDILKACRTWKGPQLTNIPYWGRYEQFYVLKWGYGLDMAHEATPEDIGVANKFIQRGIVRWQLLDLVTSRMPEQIFNVLSRSLSLSSLPNDFLKNVNARGFFKSLGTLEIRMNYLNFLGVDVDNPSPIQNEFIGKYVPGFRMESIIRSMSSRMKKTSLPLKS